MSSGECIHEVAEANKVYANKCIDRSTYENRIKYAIYRIWKAGNKEKAIGIARAHGYNMEILLKEYSR